MDSVDRINKLATWKDPSSPSEKDRQERAVRMVKAAIQAHSAFDGANYRVYAKGSYPNNTNVRIDSDVDVVVECTSCIYYEFGTGVTPPPAGSIAPYSGTWTTAKWRGEVTAAITQYFGASDVDSTGNCAVTIAEKPGSRPSTDVVPSFEFHLYWDANRTQSAKGTKTFMKNGKSVDNYPEQQLLNGQKKNAATNGRYKQIVRCLKNVENYLVDHGGMSPKPSYLMECLVWNVPDKVLTTGSLDDAFKQSLIFLFGGLTESGGASGWVEPNGIKFLFHPSQKWVAEDARELITKTWVELGYQ